MGRDFVVVDAFTGEPFAGNPAAVILDAQGLDDRRMQAVAAEFNLSETTFILPRSDVASAAPRARGAFSDAGPPEAPQAAEISVRFRWFTPRAEVDMCGHATIAGVHAMIEAGGPAVDEQTNPTIHIETRAGTLTAFVERHPGTALGCMIWLELIKPTFTRSPLSPVDLAAPLNLTADGFDPALPMVKTQDQDLLVFVENVVTLNNARPDSARLGDLLVGAGLRGLCLATVNTLSPSVHVQSRFFCPQLGVDEDPVTGSVHGPLAVYLVNHGVVEVHEGLAGLMCVQGKAGGRAGVVWALVQGENDQIRSVRIGGQAVTTMRGTLVE